MDGYWIEKSYYTEPEQQKPKPKQQIKLLKLNKNKRESELNEEQKMVEEQTMNTENYSRGPMTVTSLGLSLINLFDRLKLTICNMIKHDCSKLK